MPTIVCKPKLGEKVALEDSRTGAFVGRHFGTQSSHGAAVDLLVPGKLDDLRALTFEVLLDLVLRMEPVVTEVRITADDDRASDVLTAAAERIPLERVGTADGSLSSVAFGVGQSQAPFIEVSDWSVGFNRTVPAGRTSFIAGPFLGAIEASKYVFLRAAHRCGFRPIVNARIGSS